MLKSYASASVHLRALELLPKDGVLVPDLWDALTASAWPANPDSFFRLDWLDRLLPPKSKAGSLNLHNPTALPAPDADGAFCEDVAFAEAFCRTHVRRERTSRRRDRPPLRS